MNNDRLDDLIKKTAQDYNDPPAISHDRLWSAIESRLSENCEDGQATESSGPEHVKDPQPIHKRSAWLSVRKYWPVQVAAVLVLGIAIGRWSIPDDRTDQLAIDNDPTSQQTVDGEMSTKQVDIYAYAAAPILRRVETLLTEYQVTDSSDNITRGKVESYSERASVLRAQTLLLMGTEAANDPEMGKLLRDLELILTQIIFMVNETAVEDQKWIERGIENRSLLPRIRNRIPAGIPVV